MVVNSVLGHFIQRSLHPDQFGISPLIPLKIDMITDLPFDYMHLVCLGVTKRLLNHWISDPKLTARLPDCLMQKISSHLLLLSCYIRREFARKPRALSELCR